MSMKRILGTMLASRMAGRGRGRGALGTSGALGLLGSGRKRRRGGTGSKMGLAALGYMAYRAYQDNQSKQGGTTARAGTTGTSGGGLVDQIKDAANQILGGGNDMRPDTANAASGAEQPREQDLQESEAAAERFTEDEALLLIRAMITAAYSDGALSQDERGRIMQAIDDADASPEDRAALEREIANPKPLDELLAQVNDDETAEEFYMASRAAVDGETEADRQYLAYLRDRLGLTAEDAAEAETIAS